MENTLVISRETDYISQFLFSGQVFKWTNQISVPAFSPFRILFSIGFESFIHFISRDIQTSSNNINVFFYENTSILANGGTTSPISNADLISSNASNVTIYTSPTIAVLGNLLETISLVPSIAWTQVEPELVLKKNAFYLLTGNNTNATPAVIDFNYIWYEELDRNYKKIKPISKTLHFSVPSVVTSGDYYPVVTPIHLSIPVPLLKMKINPISKAINTSVPLSKTILAFKPLSKPLNLAVPAPTIINI